MMPSACITISLPEASGDSDTSPPKHSSSIPWSTSTDSRNTAAAVCSQNVFFANRRTLSLYSNNVYKHLDHRTPTMLLSE